MSNGPLALVGGAAWQLGCDFDAELLERSGGVDVVVLPTAAAYEQPQRLVDTAAAWFEGLGAKVEPVMALHRGDAADPALVDRVRAARFLYLAGGSPMHLRSVLKDTPMLDALLASWGGGAVLAASGGAAMALCDPMVDPRGGAYTVGLGVVTELAFISHHDTWHDDQARRTLRMAPVGLPVVGADQRTAILWVPGEGWKAAGAGDVVVFVDGVERGVAALPEVGAR